MANIDDIRVEQALQRQILEQQTRMLNKIEEGLLGTDDRNPGVLLRTDRLEQSAQTTKRVGAVLGGGLLALVLNALAQTIGIK